MVDKSLFLSIFFIILEYFDKFKNELVVMEENIKFLVFDKVYKMFDRSFNFRACYDIFKLVKDEFKNILIMVLIVIFNDL